MTILIFLLIKFILLDSKQINKIDKIIFHISFDDYKFYLSKDKKIMCNYNRSINIRLFTSPLTAFFPPKVYVNNQMHVAHTYTYI